MAINKLLDIMKALRDPATGCPWDIKQSFESIAPYTIEEAYEVAEAIDQGDMKALKSELGDLLFQVVFYAQMAEEQGAFSFDNIVEGISEKLTRRHPHVFAGKQYKDEAELRADWESHKLKEQGAESILDGVPKAVPSLKRATKLGKRAASQGFDWSDAGGVLDKIAEEAKEVAEAAENSDREALQEEFGDLLTAMTSLGRHLGVDPEESLRLSNNKFERRIRAMEALMTREDTGWKDYDADGLEVLWELAKTREQTGK